MNPGNPELRQEVRVATSAVSLVTILAVLILLAGCSGAKSGGTDTPGPSTGDADVMTEPETTLVDSAVGDVVAGDSVVEVVEVVDVADEVDVMVVPDVVYGGDAVNPGCGVTANVVDHGVSLSVSIDLSDYEAREYRVQERIVVVPKAPGESISLYGASLLLGGANLPYSYNGNVVTFCTGAFDAGEEVTIDLEYLISEAVQNFPPGSLAGVRVWGQTDGTFAIGPFTSPFFTSTWLLVPQTQSWFNKANSGNVIAQRFELTVVVPNEEWVVIGPGAAEVEGDSWSFLIEQAVPLYTLSFAASPDYELVDAGTTDSGVQLLAGVTEESKPALLKSLEACKIALDWMSDQIGPYPWGDTLAIAEIPVFSGGMEHTAAMWIGSPAIDGGEVGDYVAVHEAVHHWWGNYVQIADWPHFWLSEGFTEWTTIFNVLETAGEPGMAKGLQDYYRQKAAESSYPASSNLPLPGPLRFDDEGDIMQQVMNNLLYFYYYGAAFLEMVDQRLQRDFATSLVPILQVWYEKFGGLPATTEDFLALLAEETGETELWGQLFDQWVYTGPAPTLELSGYAFEDGEVSLTIARTGGADQDLSTLEVGFVAGDVVVLESVALPTGTDTVMVQATIPQQPTRIVIDPDGLYILRLETETDFAGPSVERML